MRAHRGVRAMLSIVVIKIEHRWLVRTSRFEERLVARGDLQGDSDDCLKMFAQNVLMKLVRTINAGAVAKSW